MTEKRNGRRLRLKRGIIANTDGSGSRGSMKRLILAIAAVGVAAMPLVAQHQADPDKKVAGGGTLPSGWKGRLDSGDKSLAGVKAMQMGGGVHFTTGPAGIYYKPADKG